MSEQNLADSLIKHATDIKSSCRGNTFLENLAWAVVSAIVVGIVPAVTAILVEVGFLSGQGSR